MLLDNLTFDQLLWLIPILLTIHNAEEAPGMASWSRKMPVRIHPIVTTRQFVIAVTLLTLACFVVTGFAIPSPKNSFGIYIMVGIQTIMLVNALAPHLIATIRFRMYAPGVVTAVLLNIPFSIYLIGRAINEGWLDSTAFISLLVIAPFALLALGALFLQIGKWIENFLIAKKAQ
ncbi:hypothetical protein ANRL2_03054 [Anaerolineae bacterium]|nr:hypothetical protein ANRL2_03054 [Anaerolineae bacterium]